MRAWLGLLRGHRALHRELNARLQAQHGLTQNDYEVLAQLSRAPEHRLRRVDLAHRLQLTASGITRLLDGLERGGLVAKHACETDARVAYAILTDAGHEKLRAASKTHIADIEELLGDLEPAELDALGSLPLRLGE